MSSCPGSVRAAVLAACALAAVPAFAAPLTVRFSQCSEFLAAQGVPAALDAQMEYVVNPPSGAGSALYAAVAPEIGDPTRFFLDGSVNTPTFATTFLANWWRLNGKSQIRMQTDFPTIAFDFASSVAFTTNSDNLLGQLTGTNRVTNFAITYCGLYDAATMAVDSGP